MRESVLERRLVVKARAKGVIVRKVRWIGRRGAPDRLLLFPGGRHVWVEMKAPGKRAAPHQQREHEALRSLGAIVEVIDSMDAIDGLFNA